MPMNDQDLRIQTLQMRLSEAETSEQVLALLQEVHALIEEHPAKETYLLLEQSFRMLRDTTSDEPEEARTLIMEQLLPWLLMPNLPESASLVQSDCYDILQGWINQYPDPLRHSLLQASMDRVITALRTQPTQPICWIISTLGYRRPDLAAELWNVVKEHDDILGDTALRTLARIGVQDPEQRQRLLDAFHHRIANRITLPLLGGLSDLADTTTIPVIAQYLQHFPQATEEELPFARTLALKILADIADTHSINSHIQQTIWDTVVSLYLAAPERYVTDIGLNSQLVPRCNDPRIPQQLLQWLEQYPEDTERSRHTRYLFYLRLLECIRLQQLQGIPVVDVSPSTRLLYQDAQQDTKQTGLWATHAMYVKERAWDVLLYLGDPKVLLEKMFENAVVQETSGFVRQEILELLACFRWKRLPSQVITWITERVDLSKETAAQELAFRRSAEHLARSAQTPEAFEALLAFGMTFQGEAMRETANTLANVALGLVKRGEPGIIEKLVASLDKEKAERHRLAALQALLWIADSQLLPPEYQTQVTAALEEPQRTDLERSYLVHILGSLSSKTLIPGLFERLQRLADSRQPHTAISAVEELVHTGMVLKTPHLLEKYLPLHHTGAQWNCEPDPRMGYETVGLICSLYTQDPNSLAPAMAALLVLGEGIPFSLVLRALNEVHTRQDHPLSEEVRGALRSRLETLGQRRLFDASSDLLRTSARLVPQTLVEWPWEKQGRSLDPETRTTLAEVLGENMPESTQQQRIRHLLRLTGDANFQVRRAAYRSLAQIAPTTLLQISITWAYASQMEWRRRAAEALNWLPAIEEYGPIAHRLLTTLLAYDAEPFVRHAVRYEQDGQQRRRWASDYLHLVRKAYGKSNKQRLLVWRYAHALAQIGNDTTITELQRDLDTKKLAPYERQWLSWILKHLQDQWKKTVEKWPKAWFAWDGEFIYERGSISVSEQGVLPGTFYLYPHEATGHPTVSHWWGTFFSETNLPWGQEKKGEIVLSDSRRGKVEIVKQTEETGWQLEVSFERSM
jgi:hypothetical protein